MSAAGNMARACIGLALFVAVMLSYELVSSAFIRARRRWHMGGKRKRKPARRSRA